MGVTRFPRGVSSWGVPVLPGSHGEQTSGNVFFADSAVGNDGYDGSFDSPFATWDYAYGKCTASNGDIIYLKEGHAETYTTTASSVTCDVIGVTTIGLGKGSLRPTFTFAGTANTASVVISAASTVIRNIIGVAADDGLLQPFHVQAADCELDITWRDTTSYEAATCIRTTASADRLKVRLKYEGDGATGSACVSPIALVGVDGAEIEVDFYGIASTAIVNMLTTACTDINITGVFNNVGTTDLSLNVVASVGSCKWYVHGFDAAAGVEFEGGDGNAISVSADLTTISSDLIVTNAIVDQIYSDTGNIRTDATGILSDLETIKSDLLIIKSDVGAGAAGLISDLETVKSDLVLVDAVVDNIYSDTGNIRTDVTEILSDLETAKSDIVVLMSDAGNIYSDTGNIRTDVTEILSDLETAKSDIVVLMSDTGSIYSDTGNIRTDVTEILSDLETVKSDLVLVDTVVDGIVTAIISNKAALQMISDANAGNASDSTITITDIGVLTGISQILDAVEPVDAKLSINIDGAGAIQFSHFTTYTGALSDVITNSLSFDHPFGTSLVVKNQKSVASGTLYTFVSYTTD